MEQFTPMMEQYLKTKKEYKDCILFYRLGDFYEMFFDDAKIASKELELTLTGKDCGQTERAPMCGVPYHAVESYLNKLVSNGHKVAVCEQMEDPRFAKGLVKREVVRIVTPGTNIDAQALDESKHNYIMSIVYVENRFGISTADVSTGDFFITEVEDRRNLLDELYKFMPAEIICSEAFEMSGVDIDELKNSLGIMVYPLDAWYFDDSLCRRTLEEHFSVTGLGGLGLEDFPCGVLSGGSLLKYLEETQKSSLSNITELKVYHINKYMVLDSFTRRNLELTETLREKQKNGSLLWVLDKTKTAMGARTLRSYIEQPLISMSDINSRLEAVSELKSRNIDREELREYLGPVYDLERLICRITYKTAGPRDLLAFGSSLAMLPSVKYILKDFKAPLLRQTDEEIDALADLHTLIESAICDDPPVTVREGGMIRVGYNEEVDRLKSARTDSKKWLADLEEREKNATGIKNLRIKYNKVFGYYIEITNSYKDQVPDTYIRKQTLTNAERYIIPELKELEDTILNAEDKLYALEYELFCNIRDSIGAEVKRVSKTAKALAVLDVLASFAYVAEKNRYVCPVMNESGIIEIKDGRHPVVEKMMKEEMFIPNDTYLDGKEQRVSVITGPNMAGKSTYMRQTALIVLMAQIGSFVPAGSAEIGIVDRIFTRVGASDDLAQGQSTFMVEMTEVANILRCATSKSLLILDEIGRGTSTFDGLSIAWAVIEYISDLKILGAKTLFATHYHELTELEGKIGGVHNYCIAVKEQGDDIVFLRKIVKGGADKSYGIQVARLAGVPAPVIDRAKEIVQTLSDTDITENMQELFREEKQTGTRKVRKQKDQSDPEQVSLFSTVKDEDILNELRDMELSVLTPLEALNTLDRLQKKLNNRW